MRKQQHLSPFRLLYVKGVGIAVMSIASMGSTTQPSRRGEAEIKPPLNAVNNIYNLPS